MQRRELTVRTTGRAFIELAQDVASIVRESAVADGLCNVFVPHISACWQPMVDPGQAPAASSDPMTPSRGASSRGGYDRALQ
jgi:hypothetical protein